jgi:hypothetical protein
MQRLGTLGRGELGPGAPSIAMAYEVLAVRNYVRVVGVRMEAMQVVK